MAKCQSIIGVIIKTGVENNRLPACTSSIALPDLTQKMLNWWKQNPEHAENPAVLSVAYAIRALKPC